MHGTVRYIRNAMKSKNVNLSYAKLAELIGEDESKVKRVLGGTQQMTLEMRDAIFDALNIKIVEYVPFDINPNDIIEVWLKMPRKMQHSLFIHMHAIARTIDDERIGITDFTLEQGKPD